MEIKNRCLALALSAILVLSATACGNSINENSSETGKSANTTTDPFEAARTNIATATSLDAKMVTEIETSFSSQNETQSFQMITTMDMNCFYDPLRLKAETSIKLINPDNAANTENRRVSLYADTDESGKSTMYLNYGSEWFSQAASTSELASYDPANNMRTYFYDSSLFKEAGTEQVNGANAYKYTGVLPQYAAEELLLSTAANVFSLFGMYDPGTIDGISRDLGEIAIVLWIDEATLYPVKYEIDMTEPLNTLMQALMKNLVEGLLAAMGAGGIEAPDISVSISKAIVTMTCYNYNAAADFSIPAEAISN